MSLLHFFNIIQNTDISPYRDTLCLKVTRAFRHRNNSGDLDSRQFASQWTQHTKILIQYPLLFAVAHTHTKPHTTAMFFWQTILLMQIKLGCMTLSHLGFLQGINLETCAFNLCMFCSLGNQKIPKPKPNKLNISCSFSVCVCRSQG